MRLALAEGRKGAGFVAPNPLVGCVILNRHMQLIGTGFHARLGEAHAEVNALAAVKEPAALVGAHVYVTLEPCAHAGRTPSCAKTLAELPIASVTFGLNDPNPLVSGQGAQILRAAGKTVILFSELQIELEELSEIFLLNMRKRRAFVALKVAMSMDGKIALPDGTSQWITGEPARARVQSLRGEYDAVLCGLGTFLKDNPRMNSRDPRFASRPARMVLLDPDGLSLSRLKGSALLSVRAPEDVTVVTRDTIRVVGGYKNIQLPCVEGTFQLEKLLSELCQQGINSVFVEGGAATYSAFVAQNLVDRIYLFMAPKLLGSGVHWLAGWSAGSLDGARRLEHLRTETYGNDLLVTGVMR
jgi:diaminohydroxyphosphoribosylaminopyrimidine deaminase/5-amino-6-(5-phosphoribosylamino)uracil reductase